MVFEARFDERNGFYHGIVDAEILLLLVMLEEIPEIVDRMRHIHYNRHCLVNRVLDILFSEFVIIEGLLYILDYYPNAFMGWRH